MQLTVPTHSLLGRILGKPQRQQERLKQEAQRNADHITMIASQYGYKPDSEEVRSLLDDYVEGAISAIATAFSQEERWHATFDPRHEKHVEYRNGVLTIMKYPFMITRLMRNCGAARADIVRARLAEGWEESCDKIVVDSHLTTFFEGDTPIVIFYGSGRDSWGRVANAVDALTTHAGITIDEKDVFVKNEMFKRIPDLIIEKVNGTWTWPTRRIA